MIILYSHSLGFAYNWIDGIDRTVFTMALSVLKLAGFMDSLYQGKPFFEILYRLDLHFLYPSPV